MGERLVDDEEVAGSIPAPPTWLIPLVGLFIGAVAGQSQKVWVTSKEGLITVLYPDQQRIVCQIKVGSPLHRAAFSPDGRYFVVADEGADRCLIVGARSGKILAHIPTGKSPGNVAVASDSSKAWVTCAGDAAVVEIDLIGLQPLSRIPVGSVPMIPAFSPHHRQLLIACQGSDSVFLVSDSHPPLSVPVGKAPYDVVISPDGNYAFVNCRGSDEVVAVRLPDGTLARRVGVGKRPWLLALARDKLISTNFDDGTVTILTLPDLKLIGTLPVGRQPRMPVLTPDGRLLFVLNAGSNDVTVIDLDKTLVIKTIPVGSRPHRGCVTKDGRWLIVGNQDEGTVSLVRLPEGKEKRRLFVEKGVMAVEGEP